MRELGEVPVRIARLPKDHRGYPIPWFVAYVDGVPDFRIADARKQRLAVRENRCWVCGDFLGGLKAFVIGPMCAITRVSSDPPNHVECAMFSARVCPFLSMPTAKRREANKPDGLLPPGGLPIYRNPGVALVWVTRKFTIDRAHGGALWKVGDPESLHWLVEGREATREEIVASIDSGLPILLSDAQAEGIEAVRALRGMHRAVVDRLLPAGV